MYRRVLVGRGTAAILIGVGMFVGVCGIVRATDRQVVADVQCVVVGLRMVQMTAPQQQAAGMMLAIYYLGRLDHGAPDAEVEGMVEKEAEKMTAAELRANSVRCGKALAWKGLEIQKIGADLSGKPQGGAAPK